MVCQFDLQFFATALNDGVAGLQTVHSARVLLSGVCRGGSALLLSRAGVNQSAGTGGVGLHRLLVFRVGAADGTRVFALYAATWELTLLDVRKNTKTTLRRNQARDHFLSHIFGRRSQQVFKLNRRELLDNRGLLRNALLKALFKFVEFAFLLVEVLDETSSALLHFVESTLQTYPERSLVALAVFDFVTRDGVLRVPHIVSDEFLNALFPSVLQLVLTHVLNFLHQAVDVLDQDVVACD